MMAATPREGTAGTLQPAQAVPAGARSTSLPPRGVIAKPSAAGPGGQSGDAESGGVRKTASAGH